jgi:hypothetical protein
MMAVLTVVVRIIIVDHPRYHRDRDRCDAVVVVYRCINMFSFIMKMLGGEWRFDDVYTDNIL